MKRCTPPIGALVALAFLFTGTSCSFFSGRSGNDEIIAEVGDQVLTTADVADLIPTGLPTADSVRLITDYVNSWVRTASLTAAAGQRFADDEKLNRLVENYRNSLLTKEYESYLLDGQVDTIISEEELRALYDSLAASMRVEVPLIAGSIYRFLVSSPQLDSFEAVWQSLDPEEPLPEFAASYIDDFASLKLAPESGWQELNLFASALPDQLESSIKPGVYVVTEGDSRYYCRIITRVNSGEPVPLDYVRGRLRKMILERRRADYLNVRKEQLYQQALSSGAVKIYIGDER